MGKLEAAILFCCHVAGGWGPHFVTAGGSTLYDSRVGSTLCFVLIRLPHSTYVVSRQHLHIAYNDTCLQEHREVNRSKGQGQQNKHRRFLERSNEVTHFHPSSRLKPSGRMFVLAAGKNVAVHVSYKTHIASLHYIENFSTYIVSRRSRSTPLSGTFERSHRIFHKHREV